MTTLHTSHPPPSSQETASHNPRPPSFRTKIQALIWSHAAVAWIEDSSLPLAITSSFYTFPPATNGSRSLDCGNQRRQNSLRQCASQQQQLHAPSPRDSFRSASNLYTTSFVTTGPNPARTGLHGRPMDSQEESREEICTSSSSNRLSAWMPRARFRYLQTTTNGRAR